MLRIVADDRLLQTTRLASALCFKNLVRRRWADEDGNYLLPEDEVVNIKKELIGLMISVPTTIQSQLGEAISVIADSDFYERWDTLVDDLASRLTRDDAKVNNGVLQVAHSIFRRWRPLFRTDALATEINHVLSKFSQPFLLLLQNTDANIDANSSNTAVLKEHFATLDLIFKLLYDLSCQDLPPAFEDNLQAISSVLQKYLAYDNATLRTDDEDEAGPLEFSKAGIFAVLTLWIQKYNDPDAFEPLAGSFVSTSWTMLTSIGLEPKYDILVSKALQFLTAVVRVGEHAQNFNNAGVLGQVVEKVIIPNLTLRDTDVELFEDEPIEYIRRDLEGSDSDTRRRAATDFLRSLQEKFEQLVTDVVSQYVTHFISAYAKNRRENWKSKDLAVYLFSSIAAKGAPTAAHGIRATNTSVSILNFFQDNIASDLVSADTEAVLKVDAIKYLYLFRSQMNKQQWLEAFPLLVQHLASQNYVVYTYAAIALERILSLTGEDNQPVISKSDVVSLSRDLLQHLFKLIQENASPEKLQENEFLMKCVMRVLIVIRDDLSPISDMVLTNLIEITRVIGRNPSNPRFYYYHFEAMGALIRFTAPSAPEKMERTLYVPFAEILQNDVQEFIPYVFQLFAALLEANPLGPLSEYYRSLIPPILTPMLWESKGSVPALVRLLSSMVSRGATDMATSNQLEPVLGIFQKLVSSKANESHAFDLLECVVSSFAPTVLEPYWAPIIQIMLTRLDKSRTENFSLRFVRFYHFVSALDDKGLGPDFFINAIEQVQQGYVRQAQPQKETCANLVAFPVSSFPSTSKSSFPALKIFLVPTTARQR